jgi:hypothetical protein
MLKVSLIFVITLAASFANVGAANPSNDQASPGYHLVSTIPLEIEDVEYLVLDSASKRLYGASNAVIDLNTESVVGRLPRGFGHGVAVAALADRVVTAQGDLFSLSTSESIGHVRLMCAGCVRNVIYDSVMDRFFFLGGYGGDNVTVASSRTGDVVGGFSFPSPARVMDGAVSASGHIYITYWTPQNGANATLANKISMLADVDTVTLKVQHSWTLPDCFEARAVQVDEGSGRLFVTCREKVAVLDRASGSVISMIPVEGAATSIAFDSERGLLFVPTDHGSINVVQTREDGRFARTMIGPLPGAESAIALDERTRRLFVGAKRNRRVIVLVLAP